MESCGLWVDVINYVNNNVVEGFNNVIANMLVEKYLSSVITVYTLILIVILIAAARSKIS
jgi:hypothetical protein